jgi:DNA-binding IscR family transcriptional regulator
MALKYTATSSADGTLHDGEIISQATNISRVALASVFKPLH